MEPWQQAFMQPRKREYLIERLGSARAWERDAALREIQEMGGDPVLFLLRELQRVPYRTYKKNHLGIKVRIGGFWLLKVTSLCIGIVIGMVCAPESALMGKWEWPEWASLDRLQEDCQKKLYGDRVSLILRALRWFDDLRVLGPLCEMRPLVDEETCWLVDLKLHTLLRQLQPQDVAGLTSPQRQCLVELLQSSDSVMVLGAVHACGCLGETRILPQIERLMASHVSVEVRDAAQDLLPRLRELAEREKASQTLLRGAAAPKERGVALLRPANSSQETAPEQLLRPHGSEN